MRFVVEDRITRSAAGRRAGVLRQRSRGAYVIWRTGQMGDGVACGASWWVLCNALVLCDSEVLACQIGVTGRAVARAVKGPASGGEGGMRARAAAKAASAW